MTKSQGLVPKKILEGQVWCLGRQWGDHPWMWKTRQVTRPGRAQGWAIPWWVIAPSPCQSSGRYRSIAGSKQLSWGLGCRRSQGTLPTPLLHWKWKWKLLSRVRLLATPRIVHGILQARILEWVAFPFSRGTQGSDPGLRHDRQILYQLSHQGSPLSFRAQHFIHTNFHFHFPTGVVIKAWILERELESWGLFPFFIALGTSLCSLWGQQRYSFMGLLWRLKK